MKLVYKSVEHPAPLPTQKPKTRTWGRQTIFPFGKYRGLSLIKVIVQDARYISWCLENVGGFVLDEDANEAYEAFKSEV